MSLFAIGASYTRPDINKVIGGEQQIYLPSKAGRVVCACLKPTLNRDAPKVILVGAKTMVLKRGRTLANQGGSIPVFIKGGSNDWRYAGDFEVASWSEDQAEINKYQAPSGRNDARMVIHMRAVMPP
jgi:hypothetical protein